MNSSDDKGLGIKGWLSGQKPRAKPQDTKAEQVVLDKHRLAVLPFSNISPDAKDEYFADGMTEELISTLSVISGLRVIARTSVMKYKGTSKGVREIGQELRTGTVLEGSVRKAENRLRATVQLIDAISEEHLWGQSFDRDLKDIFEVQSDIARNIAEALRVRLVGSEDERIERAPTVDMEAYNLYLRGRYFWNQRTREGLRNSIALFEQAIKEDPNFALAYAGLADSYALLVAYGHLSKEGTLKARANATKALKLDETLAEAHASMADILLSEWKLEDAGRELAKTLELKPSYATAHQWHAIYLSLTGGRLEERISEMKLAVELDPLSPIIRTNLGAHYYQARQFDKAIEEFRSALEDFPDYPMLHIVLGRALVQTSKYEEGISELQKAVSLSGNDAWTRANIAFGYALSGMPDKANAILDELKELATREYIAPSTFALICLGLGQKDEALRLLDMAYEESRGGLLNLLWVEPLWGERLSGDPRYIAFLHKLGLK